MCVLILLRGLHPDFPILAASSREEDPKRPTMPPGLKVLGARRALCPQDRRFGGTWIGVNDAGLLAALTNFPGTSDPDASSRGLVTLEALSQSEPEAAMRAVRDLVSTGPTRPFQLLVAGPDECRYARYAGGHYFESTLASSSIVMTNLLEPERCELRGLDQWSEDVRDRERDIEAILDHLVVSLATGRGQDRQTEEEFSVCIREGERRTVSGTLIALPHVRRPRDLEGLRFRYAAGNPLEVPFRNYDGLSRRLQ